MTLPDEYADWLAHRQILSAREANGDYPSSDEWQGSDDDGIELLTELLTKAAELLLPCHDEDEDDECPKCGWHRPFGPSHLYR